MKKLLIASIAIAMMLATPVFAWDYTWTEGWESGDLSNWTVTNGGFTVNLQNTPYPTHTGAYSVNSNGTTLDKMHRDMETAAAAVDPVNNTFSSGQVEMWIYDDMDWTLQDDLRMSINGDGGVTGGHNAATISNTSTGTYGSKEYYVYGWSYSYFVMNGVTLPSYAGTTWTIGAAAPRTVGWHRWRATWSFDYTAGVADFKWYVDNTFAPKMSMTMVSTCARWANTSKAKYFVIGNLAAVAHGPSVFDDAYFRGNLKIVPEPSSFLALGAGLAGLVGFIRRRR